MTPKEFLVKYLPFAEQSEHDTGISKWVTLSQGAIESGWGEKSPQNNMFGIKSFGNPKQQLLTTFEYSKKNTLTPQQIGLVSVTSVSPSTTYPGFFKYTGQSWFRTFDTPAEAFIEHAQIFFRVPSYAEALKHRDNPEMFVRLMAPFYAQSPGYADTVISIMHSLQKIKL